jgi:hypothetical protein
MIATLDTETAGLFGSIRLMGWYDGQEYRESRSAKEWWEHAETLCRDNNPHVWYAHNLDFDLAKLFQAIPAAKDSINWGRSIWINGRAVKVVFSNDVELHDSMTLLPGSLDSVLRSWGTEIGKLSSDALAAKGGYKDKDDYFKRVPVTDKNYREYLRHDVMGLYEVIKRLQEFTGLSEGEFCKKLTTASLAMKLYQTWYPKEYSFLSQTRWKIDSDKSFRRAFYGGRTEVFQTHVENGFHYDVNSLYPFVMGDNAYPYDYPSEHAGEAAQKAWDAFQPDVYGNRFFKACIVTARVFVPTTLRIPPLPVRYRERLLFPVGEIKGTWCGCELENAVNHGCVVLQVYEVIAWTQTCNYFTGWVEKMSKKKRSAHGAEREFYKLLQNSLYGKFAQRREQTNIAEWTPELQKKLRSKHTQYTVSATKHGLLANFEVKRYATFMQPHIAAHITAFARIVLYNAIATEQDRGNVVVYCDTDSLVTARPMNDSKVAPTEYGLWKLERVVERGIYVSPKLYAEADPKGCETLKGKGLLRSYRETMSYQTYESVRDQLCDGVSVVRLYSGIPNRRRFLRCILENRDLDEPRMESKSVHADTWQKRRVDWSSGLTVPWTLKELAKLIGKRHTRHTTNKLANEGYDND